MVSRRMMQKWKIGMLTLMMVAVSGGAPCAYAQAAPTYEDWTKSLDQVAEKMENDRFTYDYAATGGTYAAAKKHAREANCSRYVSWSLQRAGVIPKGKVFWLYRDGSIGGDQKAITDNKMLRVMHPNKRAAKADLKRGDICGFDGFMHTAVYAGRNAKGQMMWYSAGRDGGSEKGGKWFYKAKKTAAKTRGDRYDGKICTVIRIRHMAGR